MAENSKTVLIVEDETLLSTLIKTRLEKEGFATAQVFDGKEANEWTLKNRPDIIVLDLILPKMSGFEFLELLKSNPELAQVPVVVLSNLGQESDIDRVKQLGVDTYLVKAKSSIEEIVKVIQSLR